MAESSRNNLREDFKRRVSLFPVGSEVFIRKKAGYGYDLAWSATWVDQMDDTLGMKGVVVSTHNTLGVQVDCGLPMHLGDFWYSPLSLEMVEEVIQT